MKLAIAVILGGAAGFMLYKLIGCTSGACPLIGNPYISIAYGGFLGILIGKAFKKRDEHEDEQQG